MMCSRRRPSSAAWLICALLVLLAGAACVADAAQARSALPLCQNNIDDDGDGAVDFPFDPGCSSLTGTTELNPQNTPQCADGVDNEATKDGRIDFPADWGCTAASDNNENNTGATPLCADTLDNDNPLDGKRDFLQFQSFPRDPGCSWSAETSEADTQCSDGIDNDGDGRIDFPADFGCGVAVGSSTPAVNDNSEVDPPQCDDGRDNDGDGNIDFGVDPDCSATTDNSEAPPAPPTACADGADNDGDGLIDLADPGCSSAADDDETDLEPPACADGIDNDGDGRIDLADLGCSSVTDDDENNVLIQYVLPPGNLVPSSSTPKTKPLLSPFPIVRLRGRADRRGVRVTLLTVRAPAGSKVSVYCAGRSCPRRRVAVNAGRKLVRVRQFETRLRGGTVLKVYVTRTGYIGKYTRFRFVNRRAPSRVDRCATTPGTKPRSCPST